MSFGRRAAGQAFNRDHPAVGVRQRSCGVEEARGLVQATIARAFDPATDGFRPRGELAAAIGTTIDEVMTGLGRELDAAVRRDLVSWFLNGMIDAARRMRVTPTRDGPTDPVSRALEIVQPLVLATINTTAAAEMSRGELARRLSEMMPSLLAEQSLVLNAEERRHLVTLLINDMLGHGPLEPLLADEQVTDILVNGPGCVYVERLGRMERTGTCFRDNEHLMSVIARIVAGVGRRVDERNPLVDARLPDGSRVNIIIPPLAIDGPAMSIRKFSREAIGLERMVQQGNLSTGMAKLLEIAAQCRLNILVSGGTGSGKTTLLNAISRHIGEDERIVTIEDAAELKLQQPHIVRLETRPANVEGEGEITMRDLVRNALRMRPERIIIGEIRGAEAIDMLQAMNTGHDGSLGTIHANKPRDALMRLENMVALTGFNLSTPAIRAQIAAAVDLIVQIARMRDGVRRITCISEVVGIEGDVIALQDLFHFQQQPDSLGRVVGEFRSSGLRPRFHERAEQRGIAPQLMSAMQG